MARNHDKQFYGSWGDIRDYGEATLGATGTVEVTTFLRTVKSAQVCHKAGRLVASALQCDCTITAGAVTISDPAGAVNAGATVSYVFFGHP